jgi:hypothetical protein
MKRNRQDKAPQTGYKLFIDDERNPNVVYSGIDAEGWIVVRSSQEAMDHVSKHGMPFFMSLDHDLGGDDTTNKFLLWLIQENLDERIPGKVPDYKIHSANPTGSKNLESKMESWRKIAAT